MADMADIRNIVILTGAGISAESGIDTFRAADGLWENHRIEDVASPEGFARDPDLVQRFYDMRRAAVQEKQPNAAHKALAHLARQWAKAGRNFMLVTQNVDDLHDRAAQGEGDAQNLIHMHGQLLSAWCRLCDMRLPWRGGLLDRPACTACGQSGALRPDIVWFGEMPYRMEEIYAALSAADLFVSIGTSGAVYPAAGFVQEARMAGAQTLELNLEPSEGSMLFDEARHGLASQLVPAWVQEMLAGI